MISGNCSKPEGDKATSQKYLDNGKLGKNVMFLAKALFSKSRPSYIHRRNRNHDVTNLKHCLNLVNFPGGGGGGLLPYMGCIGICGAKGYGFSAALVINRVSILAILPRYW